MREEEFGPIEQDIIKEEMPAASAKTPSASKIPAVLSKIPKIIFQVKKPKIITLAILVLAIFVIYLSLNLLSQKQKEGSLLPKVQETQPSPETSQDPSLAGIAKKVESYSLKIDALESYKKRLIKPIVDLEIIFKE